VGLSFGRLASLPFGGRARALGDHDLNSFRLRLESLAGADDLQSGMTARLAGC
jgi:hypothetical protein